MKLNESHIDKYTAHIRAYTCVRVYCLCPHEHPHNLISFKLYNLVVYAKQTKSHKPNINCDKYKRTDTGDF